MCVPMHVCVCVQVNVYVCTYEYVGGVCSHKSEDGHKKVPH